MNPRIRISETGSTSLKLLDTAIVEISVEAFSRIMRTHFGIFSEPVANRPNAVRYTGPPYDQSNEDCRSLQVFAHARGTMLSPLVIYHVLDKFEVQPTTYCEAAAGQGKLTETVTPGSKEIQ